MLDSRPFTLRDRLRRETRVDHDAVDALFGSLDLARQDGLGHFLAAHHLGFSTVRAMTPASPGRVRMAHLSQMIEALAVDLAQLGISTPPVGKVPAPVSAEAIDHIVLGSRLGTAVLRRAWSASPDEQVRAASRYFGLPGLSDLWRQHLADLKSLPAENHAGATLIEDTKRLFQCFEAAFHATR